MTLDMSGIVLCVATAEGMATFASRWMDRKILHASTDVAGDKSYFKNKLIFLDSDSTLCDVVTIWIKSINTLGKKMWSRNTWDKFISIFHSNLVNPKGLHDIWVRIKVGPERQVHFWYRWFSSCKVSGTESDYPNGGWASPSWAVNSLKSVKPSKDEFRLGCLNSFFSIPLLLYFLFLLIPIFWIFWFSLRF